MLNLSIDEMKRLARNNWNVIYLNQDVICVTYLELFYENFVLDHNQGFFQEIFTRNNYMNIKRLIT